MNNKLFYITIFFFISFLLAGDANVFNEYNAQPGNDNEVTISWLTKDESNVKYFVVMRSNDNKATFSSIAQINKKGPGYDYRYVDENVFFKSSGLVVYRIDAISSNGSTVEATGTMDVRPNLTGIFKTWGAIKAIFR